MKSDKITVSVQVTKREFEAVRDYIAAKGCCPCDQCGQPMQRDCEQKRMLEICLNITATHPELLAPYEIKRLQKIGKLKIKPLT